MRRDALWKIDIDTKVKHSEENPQNWHSRLLTAA